MMTCDERYMSRALQLAEMGAEWASPNPMVGAVVVASGRIIGEGYHQRCGQAHAEVNAIASVRAEDRHLLASSTIYVTLEPCSHYGRTPPCAELIIKCAIPRVVVGVMDPFEKVSGRGVKMLHEAGCEVVVGVLEQRCREVNRHFFRSVVTARPYLLLKWAESRDGYIGVEERQVAITSQASNVLSHRLRGRFDAIMVGTNTVVTDDCSLTVRGWFGSAPLRVVVDRSERIPSGAKVLSDGGQTLVFTESESRRVGSVEYLHVSFDGDLLTTVLDELNARGVRSLMVEGGARLLQSFIDADLADEVYRYVGGISFADSGLLGGGAVAAPRIDGLTLHDHTNIGSDLLEIYRR